MEFRKLLKMQNGSSVEMYLSDNSIIIKKYEGEK
jgi:bifunctional DNA-binding transcriptional regulator/antitoxin component of YhaV-PrlF toxin-antitoxin module